MSDWDGNEYARVSGLQRAMARDAIAALALAGSENVLDIGCGDGDLTRAIAAALPAGCGRGSRTGDAVGGAIRDDRR